MRCQRCQGERFTKEGHDREGRQVYRCSGCARRRTEQSASAFAGYRFPPDVIALAVRWYLRFRLSYADVAELLAERSVHVDPSTIYAWVQHFAPLYQVAARAHRHAPRGPWSIDETYIKVAGVPCYVFRAIDELGQVIDVFVSPTRDAAAATAFLRRAVRETDVRPTTVTTDKAAIYPPALAAVLPGVQHIAGKPAQQRIERDHGHLKGRYGPMRGFKRGRRAQVVCGPRVHAQLARRLLSTRVRVARRPSAPSAAPGDRLGRPDEDHARGLAVPPWPCHVPPHLSSSHPTTTQEDPRCYPLTAPKAIARTR